MSLPDLPFVVQANWDDSEWGASSPWDQAHANILCQDAAGQPTLHRVEIQRNLVRTAVAPETCRLLVEDRGYNLRPYRASSSLSPHLALHRRVRVLRQVTPGVWQALFFGYITSIQPQAAELSPPLCEITLESPLAVLARRQEAVPQLEAPPVYVVREPSTSALGSLLEATQISRRVLSIANVGETTIGGTWGGGTVNVGKTLAELAQIAGALLWCEPLYAQDADDPNFLIHWDSPNPSTLLTVHWDWLAGDLARTPAPETTYTDAMAAA
jgi:hypothetical protein